MENLKDKTLSGLGWSLFAQMGRQIMAFIISVILARLLAPADFGLIGMIVIFTGFAALFNELGFGAALIQKEQTEDRHYTSVFWLNIGFGFLLMLIVFAAAPWLANFFNEPRLIPLTRLISFNFFLGAFTIVQQVQLRRALDFRTLAKIEIGTIVIAGTSAIVLALMGYGPYALAWQMLCDTLIRGILFWMVSDWHPRFQFDRQAVHELFSFSSNLLGSNIMIYWVRRADNLIIGKFLGSEALGIYSRAYGLMLLPLTQVTQVVSRVMFPALSRIQADKARIKRVYLRSISSIALITFPLMLGLLVVADSFILTIYGPKWGAVIPVLQILCMVGLLQSILSTIGWLYTSQGRTDLQLWWTVGGGLLTFLAFAIGVQWGVIGVAIAYAVRVYGTIYFAIAIPGKLINMTFFEVVKTVASIFGCAVVMAVLVWGVGWLLPLTWPHWAYLAVQVPFGALVYGGLVHLFKLRAYQDVQGILLEQWRLLHKRRKLQASESIG